MQRNASRRRALPRAALGALLAIALSSAAWPKSADVGAGVFCWPGISSKSRVGPSQNAGPYKTTAVRAARNSRAADADGKSVVAQPGARAKPRRAPKKKEAPTGAPLCQSKNVTVELPREFLSLVVLNNSFIAKNNSVGVMTFQNFFPQAIQEIAVVAEYRDDTGKPIYPGVFAASATQVVTPSWFATYLPSQYQIASWPQPIAPHATFTLGATSGITTAACPAQIAVTLLHLLFADGKEMNYSAPNWQLPAQPEQIPGDLELSVPQADLPQEFLVKVRVPAPLGPIIPLPEVQLVNGKPGLIFDRIRDQMQAWRFWFAMRSGQSVDGDDLLLIRLHSPKEKPGPQMFWVAPGDVPQPLGIIDLVPQRAPGKWAVYYGGANLSDNSVPQMQ